MEWWFGERTKHLEFLSSFLTCTIRIGIKIKSYLISIGLLQQWVMWPTHPSAKPFIYKCVSLTCKWTEIHQNREKRQLGNRRLMHKSHYASPITLVLCWRGWMVLWSNRFKVRLFVVTIINQRNVKGTSYSYSSAKSWKLPPPKLFWELTLSDLNTTKKCFLSVMTYIFLPKRMSLWDA